MVPEETTTIPLPTGAVLASFWRRGGGLAIDQVVAAVIPFSVALMVADTAKQTVSGATGFWVNVSLVAIGLLHETVGVWRWGRTLGKLVTGTRVVHAVDGGRVSLSAAFLRSLVPAAFGVIPGIGVLLGLCVYMWAFIDPRRQGVHDKAAATLVVR